MLLLTLTLCLGLASAEIEYDIDQADSHFENFIVQFNKSYESDEEKQLRYNIFKENLQEIINTNLEHGYNVLGFTQFSDMSKEEFRSKYLGFQPRGLLSDCTHIKHLTREKAPDSFDWREQGAVTPVKRQGGCGSCWAFSTIGNVESQYAIKHKIQLDLSEQQEVDCDKINNGCNGGDMPTAFLNIMSVGGLMGESDYPYKEQEGSCKFDAKKVKAKVTGCMDFTGASEEDIKSLLVAYGPLTIGLSGENLHMYTGNVLKTCGPHINHALLIVGYGTDEATNDPYWIIKNSWSNSWGESGYLRLIRGNPDCQVGAYALATAVVE